MAMYAKDGSRHHSASRAKMHDDMAADKKNAKPAASAPAEPKPKGDGDGGEGGEDVSHMPIHEVVAKHGPAHKVEIEHDHEANTHKKTSHHGEKKHVSEHETAEEAHEHGAMAAGAQEETPDEEEETPDDANRKLAGQDGEAMGVGSSIPGLG